MLERFKRDSGERKAAREQPGAVATSERERARDDGATRMDDGASGTLRDESTRTDDRMTGRDDGGATRPDDGAMGDDRSRTDDVAAPRASGARFASDDAAGTDEPSPAAQRASARDAARRGALTGDALKTARARQRDEFGGLNWGASFFGWLVAVGVAALITGLLAAMGAAVGLTSADADVDSIGLGGGIALLAALMLAYYCGGYVAGRMSRFDGARQGMGVWIIALAVTLVLALLALVAGDDYNVLAQLNLPTLPVGESELRSGGWIVLLAVVVGTLLAAVIGGKAGERYHKRVDRAGFVD